MRQALRSCSTLALLAAGGCATISSGRYGTPVDPAGHPADRPRAVTALKVSGAEIPELSSPSFGLLEFTMENDTGVWIRIKRDPARLRQPRHQ